MFGQYLGFWCQAPPMIMITNKSETRRGYLPQFIITGLKLREIDRSPWREDINLTKVSWVQNLGLEKLMLPRIPHHRRVNVECHIGCGHLSLSYHHFDGFWYKGWVMENKCTFGVQNTPRVRSRPSCKLQFR